MLTRSYGSLMGDVDTETGVVSDTESIAAGATAHSSAPVDLLGDNASMGNLNVWLLVKREEGHDTEDANVQLRLNPQTTPAIASQPVGEDYLTKHWEFEYEANVPALDDGFKVIAIGRADSIPRRISAEVVNNHPTDTILVAIYYELEKLS